VCHSFLINLSSLLFNFFLNSGEARVSSPIDIYVVSMSYLLLRRAARDRGTGGERVETDTRKKVEILR
jgi:hypothetical protein